MQKFLPVILAGVWITLSEFVRNELLFKSYWISHYESLGLRFDTLPINGILWTVWSFAVATIVSVLLRKFSFIHTVGIVWISMFVLMWITLYNLQVLPLTLLLVAVPLSILEVVVAGVILHTMRIKA